MTESICIAHAHDRHIGYGRMGVDLAVALSEIGLSVSDWTEGWEDYITPSDKIALPGRARTVVFVSPGTHMKGWFEGQRPIAFTMWEATDLPEDKRELLHEFEQIIVPSWENYLLYSKYHNNVAYVPLGVGPEWHWRPRDPLEYEAGRPMDLPVIVGHEGIEQRIGEQTYRPLIIEETEERMVGIEVPMSSPEFVVLTAGTSPLRKGFDLTAAAFHKAFPDRMALMPRPVLMVKSPQGAQVAGVDSYVDGYLTDAEELELYQSAHVYISLARGEGFGLQPLQAIGQGIPTILTDAHGHAAFASLGYPVQARLVPARTLNGEECGYGEDAAWWEADVDEAAAKLRFIYENYAMCVERAAVNSETAHAEFSWDGTAQKLVEAMGEPLDEMSARTFSPSGDCNNRFWHELHPMKYLIRVTVEFNGNVNGVAYRYEPGKDYYDVADVKRIVHRSGVLDTSCIGADGVVKPDERLSGSHSYCPSCLQQLNSRPTKFDDLLEGMT